MSVIDEPVRGSIPPPWWWSLSGLERIQALVRGQIPRPPLSRLLGIRAGHIGPAFCTWTMPATGWLVGLPELEISLFVEAALTSTAMTAVGPAHTIEPLQLAVNRFRPVRAAVGNLVARCRVINASRFFIYTEAEIEDPSGRQLLHASSHAEVRRIEPDPPPVPAELRQVDESIYATADPAHRPLTVEAPALGDLEAWEGATGALRKLIETQTLRTPLAEFLKLRVERMEADTISMTMPASEWFCTYSRKISHGAILVLGNSTGTGLPSFLRSAHQSGVNLATHTMFLGAPIADGRTCIAETTGLFRTPDSAEVDVVVRDSQGNPLARLRNHAYFVDTAKRQRAAKPATKRVLCSLLFTDIIGSTQHAERLGDQKWHSLLEEEREKMRVEIARYNGTEIDTAGDGFFVRFDSPADALDCAVAAIHAVKSLGISIRVGVHTGECEVTGRNYAGMAVHMGARIMAAAGQSEILVSSTVRDLVMGSGRTFEDRGEHELKGVPGHWRLYALQ